MVTIYDAENAYIDFLKQFENHFWFENGECGDRFSDYTLEELRRYNRIFDDARKLGINTKNVLNPKMFVLNVEEEGFISGFMYAVNVINAMNKEAVNEEPQKRIKNEEKKEIDEFVNTRQIARMFDTQNFRIVKRIESRILPILSPNSSAKFVKYDWRTANGRTCTCYKMNKEGGMMFLRSFEKGKDTYTGIADGYTKLEEYMNR